MEKKDYFDRFHTIHFVGIKGIAMTALAVWAKEKGMNVTGSDTDENFPSVPILIQSQIIPLIGFRKEHILRCKPDVVVYTGAHNGKDNPEVQEAIRRHIPVLPHGKALGLVMEKCRQISVAGSHGKTTTSAMIATILSYAKKDPSYAVGCGEIQGLGLPGHYGQGAYFVAEADEYITDPNHDLKPRFLWQHPDILVVTNIDYDHPDAYKSMRDVQNAFFSLVKQQQGDKITIVNSDDPASRLLLSQKHTTVITYGISHTAQYRAADIVYKAGLTSFSVYKNAEKIGSFSVRVPGEHNIRNSLAAIVTCLLAGVTPDVIKKGLYVFQGARRRFDKIRSVKGITFYDDYAHHPKEIAATLRAVRTWYPDDRIIVVFQPHTYTRTKVLLPDFGSAFTDAGIVILTDIYASAREKDTMGITGSDLANEIRKYNKNVIYAANSSDVIMSLKKTIKKGDRVIFMGAGDIYTWEEKVIQQVQKSL